MSEKPHAIPGSIETKPTPPRIPRTLRCANAALYASSAAMILAAVAWYIGTHDALADQALAAAAGTVGLIWAVHYCYLRITIDQTGIHRRSLLTKRSIHWETLSHWAIETTEDQEQATCRILFFSADTPEPLIITSELIELDSVRQLAKELQGSEPDEPTPTGRTNNNPEEHTTAPTCPPGTHPTTNNPPDSHPGTHP